MINLLNGGVAFTPSCQDEKAYPDTTQQKPHLVSDLKILQRAVFKNCSMP